MNKPQLLLRACVSLLILTILGVPAGIMIWNGTHPPQPLPLKFFEDLGPIRTTTWSGMYSGIHQEIVDYAYKSDRSKLVAALKARLTQTDGWKVYEDKTSNVGHISFTDCTQEGRGYIALFQNRSGETQISLQQWPPHEKGWAVKMHLIR